MRLLAMARLQERSLRTGAAGAARSNRYDGRDRNRWGLQPAESGGGVWGLGRHRLLNRTVSSPPRLSIPSMTALWAQKNLKERLDYSESESLT